MAFASGKNAYGISDRSGFRYKLSKMRKEWNGSLVGFDEFEPKQPQLLPLTQVSDPQALQNPRPDRVEPLVISVGLPTVDNPNTLPVVGFTQVGEATVVIT
jgi:hypothetical protein|tara:strand:- start:905 stop:1207 length:303 start_codon:yes stop_codon:yes gene_type:complete